MHSRSIRPSQSKWCVGLLSVTLVASSCSATADGPSQSTGASSGASNLSGGTAGGGIGGVIGGAGPTGGGTLSLGGAPSSEPGSGGAEDSVDEDDACATNTDTARPVPSILQLVVDTSGSMDWPPGWAPATPEDSKPPGATKWDITRDALLAAVESLPGAVALGVSFFPNVQQDGDVCLQNDVGLPIQLLKNSGSSARSTWETAVTNVDPVGATPTHGAYLFGLELLAATPLPGNEFILLITDGTPTCTVDCECTEGNQPVDSEPLLEQATTALASGIRTFVIGSPGSEATRDVLSRLATNGGTAKESCSDVGPVYCHFDMTREPDLGTALADALEEIASSLRSCEYPIPAPPAGEVLDPNLVNVLYTTSTGATATIARDPSAGDCQEGWQYSADGQNIVLCGAACEQVRADAASTVEVLFGCETVTAEPK